MLTIGQCAALATIIEATAPKPGNVHRGADFEDLSYPDFVVAATMVAPVFEAAIEVPLGATVLAAVKATQLAVETNANLGTILLLAPLAKVPRTVSLDIGVRDVLARLTPDDSRDIYEAIRLARPGGLNTVETADVAGPAPENLIEAMRLAADRDLVARQYAEDFRHVLRDVMPRLVQARRTFGLLSDAIVFVHLELMSEYPDSLIARRRGIEVARQAGQRAARALAAHAQGAEAYHRALADLDFWLRADGHQRNPGTTADLIAAGLFAALRDGIIDPPFRLARLD
jgi:triphosphoribosyl-dephospho-CoA synthase